jgi:hypothetical protein
VHHYGIILKADFPGTKNKLEILILFLYIFAFCVCLTLAIVGDARCKRDKES